MREEVVVAVTCSAVACVFVVPAKMNSFQI
jgi:hypothetical protein